MGGVKAAIAALLRYRTAWQLVAITVATTISGLLIIYNTYSSTRRTFAPLLTLIFGIGGAALILAFVRRSEQRGERPAGRWWATFVAAVLGLAGTIAYATYSLGHFKTAMIAGCNAARLPETLAERQAELAEAEARLSHPLAWPVRMIDDSAEYECAETRADLARQGQGLCTRWPLVDQTCVCGEESYPYARCKEPNCLYAPGLPDKFDCPGDVIPDGYFTPRQR